MQNETGPKFKIKWERERERDWLFFFTPLNVVSTIFQSYDNDQENVCMVKIQQ